MMAYQCFDLALKQERAHASDRHGTHSPRSGSVMFSPTPRIDLESALVISAAFTGQRVLPWRCDQRRVAAPSHGILVGLLGDGGGGGAAAASAMAAERLHRRNDGVDECGVGHVRFHETVAWLLWEMWKARSCHAIARASGSAWYSCWHRRRPPSRHPGRVCYWTQCWSVNLPANMELMNMMSLLPAPHETAAHVAGSAWSRGTRRTDGDAASCG